MKLGPCAAILFFCEKCTGPTCDWLLKEEEHSEDVVGDEEDYFYDGRLMRIIFRKVE